MPIKGLSEFRRLPRIGKIHLGHKDPTRGFPVKDDFFVFPKEPADALAAVRKLYGEKPRSLDILIPVEDEELYCQQYYRKYSATQGLVCKGTGEYARVKVDTTTGAYADHSTKEFVYKDITCQGKNCGYYLNKTCKEVMNLQFMLPKIPGLGVWQIDSGSANSIININSCVTMIRGLFGRLHMIPLLLTLESKEVNNPDTGKRQTVFVLNLRHTGNLYEIMNDVKTINLALHTAFLPPVPDEDEAPDDEYILDSPANTDKLGTNESATTDRIGTNEPTAPSVAPAPAPEPIPGKPVEVDPIPTTVKAFMEWAASHGKIYTPSWVCKNINIKQPSELKNFAEAYYTLKELGGWTK